MNFTPLPKNFFLRDTLTVAKDLLGKTIVRKSGRKFLTGKIVETEAYIGEHDTASHAYGRITPRNETLYMEGGICYVYFIYGNYYCFNTVTGKEGEGSGVLIRAIEPLSGIEKMHLNRGPVKKVHDLTNGPGKLCMALNIDKSLNRTIITEVNNKVFMAKPQKPEKLDIAVSKRIGIDGSNHAHLPYRFFIKDNPYVTRHKLNKQSIQ